MLGPKEALFALLAAGILTRRALASSPVTSKRVEGSERVFLITFETGDGFALKLPRQTSAWTQSEGNGEASFTDWLGACSAAFSADEPEGPQPFLLPLSCTAIAEGASISRVPNSGRSLDELLRSDNPESIRDFGDAIGRSLAVLHSLELCEQGGSSPRTAPLPLALSVTPIHPKDYMALSAGSLRILSSIQGNSILCESLNDLRERWEREVPIHGDFQPRNVITHGLSKQLRIGGKASLIDFELGGAGPHSWDLSLFIANVVSAWFGGLRIRSSQLEPEVLDGVSHLPISVATPFLLEVIRSYLKHRVSEAGAVDLASHLAFLPAAFVQIAIEDAQGKAEPDGTTEFSVSAAALAARDLATFVNDILGSNG